MSSYSTVTQEDKSVQMAGDAKTVLGAGAVNTEAQPYSVIAGPDTTLGDIVFNQFPESVASSVKELVGAVNTAVTSSSQVKSESVTGDTGQMTKIVMYLVIGGIVLALGSRFLK